MGFIGHFKESVIDLKDNKGMGRECGMEIRYFKMFRQRSVIIFSSYKDFSEVFWVKWGGEYESLISASQYLMKTTNTFFKQK